MSHVAAKICFNQQKTCLITLSDSFKQLWKRDNDAVLEISNGSSTIYTSWSGDWTSSNDTNVGISGLFATKLGLQDGQQVTIKQVENVAVCERAFVEPLSVNDWEILELHAEYIESSLLNQIRVIAPGMIFPIWINKSICLYVKIVNFEPVTKYCILEQRTELHISPKDRFCAQDFVKNKEETPVKGSSIKKLNTDPSRENKQKKSVGFAAEVDRFQEGGTSEYDGIHNDATPSSTEKEENDKDKSGVIHKMFHSVRKWWTGDDYSSMDDLSGAENEGIQNKYLPNDGGWCCNLRVQPCGEFIDTLKYNDRMSILLGYQPCNVYINQTTFQNNFKAAVNRKEFESRTNIGFLAHISSLLSPAEKECLMKKKMEAGSSVQHHISSSQQSSETSGIQSTNNKEPVNHAGKDEKFRTKIVVRVLVLDDERKFVLKGQNGDEFGRIQLREEYGVHKDHVMISDLLRRQIQAGKTGRVLLTALTNDEMEIEVDTLCVHPLYKWPDGYSAELLEIAFKSWVRFHCEYQLPLVASNGSLLRIPIKKDDDIDIVLSFEVNNQSQKKDLTAASAGNLPFISIYPTMMEIVNIKIEKTITPHNKPEFISHMPEIDVKEIDPLPIKVSLENLGGFGELFLKILTHIEQCLCYNPLSQQMFSPSPGLCSGALMITGPKGVGKTTLAKALCQKLASAPLHAYITIVDCKHLRGKRMDNIKKTLQRCFTEAAWRQPAVIVLDNLDIICGAPAGPEQEMSGDAIYFSKVAQVISDIFKTEMCEKSHICVVVTCQSRSAVNQVLSSSRGIHYFQNVFELKAPDKEQRESILKAIMQNSCDIDCETFPHLDFAGIVKKTDGYVGRDLESVVKRAIHAHAVVNKDLATSTDIKLHNEDFNAALQGFTPSSLKNVPLHRPDDISWEDVGGLHIVRHTLVETLQWPSKYPELFANCPLRLRSGILLYGAPGTGKTLLASVVAKECGLNFISIKGPELLSKYIGASEQAVRDTFVRAQSAKPCILFFDEFESLAPRRGHDSTGVTDRVVNQLLTQLDGVEGLQGVYVLAATSRPDLIDPALLRPGRLDKALQCPLPTQEERLEILQALTKSMNLSDDTDFPYLAQRCDFFTGADFKALLYNAQLEAIHQMYGHTVDGSTGNDFGFNLVGKKSSEGSVLSNGSWEKVNISNKENEGDLLVAEHSEISIIKESGDLMQCDLAYIPSLEDGITEITPETQAKFKQKILPLLSKGLAKDLSTDVESTNSDNSITINQSHLMTACQSMGPSVSKSERRKYEIIYQNFVDSRGGNFSDGIKSAGIRATLA